MTHSRTRVATILLPIGVLALSACSQTSNAEPPASASEGTVAVATTLPATDAPTTDAPATSTTLPATTTTEPIPTLPSNVEVVGAFGQPLVAVGSRNGADTAAIQFRLNQLGFWSGNATDGRYGQATSQAVMAFQKYVGLRPTGKVDEGTAFMLASSTERAHATANSGTLVEVDKGRQLLFIVVDGKTLWTFNTSTGSEIPYEAVNKNDPTKIEKGDAVTPNGLWKVSRQRPEGWWDGDLGKIYRPKYFHGGIAIHGMTSIPGYPASHGCVRLSVPAMDFIWDSDLIPLGTPVWVHS